MKHLHEVQNSNILDRDFFVNIKLDYSAFIVKYENGVSTYHGRNLKEITHFGFENRFAILSPARSIFLANSEDILDKDGYYHFEYKNPDMEYTIDDGRDPGLYFSYFTDLDHNVQNTDIVRETSIEISRDDLKNLSSSDLLVKYNLGQEEGIVVHFPMYNDSVKVVNPYFTSYAKLKRSVNSNSKEVRAFVKAFFEQGKQGLVSGVSKNIEDTQAYKNFIFNNAVIVYADLMTDLDIDFFKTNPALLSYNKLFKFYSYELWEIVENQTAMEQFDRYIGRGNYELISFIYIVLMNLVEKELENEIK